MLLLQEKLDSSFLISSVELVFLSYSSETVTLSSIDFLQGDEYKFRRRLIFYFA